jgi:hypothetical protein
MKKFKNIKQHLYIITALAILLFSSYNSNYQQIFGHNFAGDESASFLALMDQMQNEMNLINTNLINNNQSLANDHLNEIKKLYTETIKKEIAERNERIANEISSVLNETSIDIGKENNNSQDFSETVKNFNDIIEEAVSVRIDPEALTNATVQALHFANLINSIDVYYATAVGTEPMNMSAMSMGTPNDSMSHSNTSMSNMDMDHGSSGPSMVSHMKTTNNSNTLETASIVNIAASQTSKSLTNVAIDLLYSTIKHNTPSNATKNANNIESNLYQLRDLIESKAPYEKVMGVIHGPIQTTMLETFNLPLKNSK